MNKQTQMQIQNIQIDQDLICMSSQSFVMGQSCVKFLAHDLIVDGHGVKKLSQNNNQNQLHRFSIDSKRIKEKGLIGRGSAGQVIAATYLTNVGQMPIAIKSIPADQKDKRHQLLNDLKTFLNGNYSQYLVKFYGCYFQKGLVKQVIQYMDMGSLRNIVNAVTNKKIIPSQKILASVIYKILKGLQYIHKIKHQIHRDIKPQNILINSLGEVKITDFGISKYLQMTHNFAMTFIGTAIYMSPQRIQHKDYSYNCDVWSLGLLIYQLATGNDLPYRISKNKPIFELLSNIIMRPPPSLPNDTFSPQMCHFVNRCLDKNPISRANVQQLLQHQWIKQNLDQNNLSEFMKDLSQYITL